MTTASGRPTTPAWGKVPNMGPKLKTGFFLVFMAAIVAAFLYVMDTLQNPWGGVSLDPKKKWYDSQDTDWERYGLRTFYENAIIIRNEISKLPKKVDAYKRKFSALLDNEVGKQLKDDPWVVRYFADLRNEPLPRDEVVNNFEPRLDELMYTLIKALAKEKPDPERGAYVIRPEIKLAVKQLKSEVDNAIYEYDRHMNLLEDLEARIVGRRPPKNLREARDEYLRKKGVRTFGNKEVGKPTGSTKPRGDDGAEDHSKPANSKPTTDDNGDESDLLRDVREAQSEAR